MALLLRRPPVSGPLLIQFARVPRVGRVKTRLIPRLGPAGACALHAELMQWTSRRLIASGLGPVQLWLDGEPGPELAERYRPPVTIHRQRGADLGERMLHALESGLGSHRRVLLVGSDCPWLDTERLAAAAAALDRSEVVLQPALDGGYVLIGARRVSPELFQGVEWGSERVYRQTADRLQGLGLRWQALEPLPDVDRPEDLAAWEALRSSVGAG